MREEAVSQHDMIPGDVHVAGVDQLDIMDSEAGRPLQDLGVFPCCQYSEGSIFHQTLLNPSR